MEYEITKMLSENMRFPVIVTGVNIEWIGEESIFNVYALNGKKK